MITKDIEKQLEKIKDHSFKIKDEFLKNGSKQKKLSTFVLNHSKNYSKLQTEDIDSVINNSPYLVCSYSFLKYFFKELLGENTYLKYVDKQLETRSLKTSYYMRYVEKFLIQYTNIEDIINDVLILFELLGKTDIYLIIKDPNLLKKIELIKKIFGVRKKEYKQYFSPINVDFSSLPGGIIILTTRRGTFIYKLITDETLSEIKNHWQDGVIIF